MAVILTRQADRVSANVKAAGTINGQGQPTYAAPVTIQVVASRVDDVARASNGDEVKTQMTMWIDAGQSKLPEAQDRVELADGSFSGIVVERLECNTISNRALDHIEIKLREV